MKFIRCPCDKSPRLRVAIGSILAALLLCTHLQPQSVSYIVRIIVYGQQRKQPYVFAKGLFVGMLSIEKIK